MVFPGAHFRTIRARHAAFAAVLCVLATGLFLPNLHADEGKVVRVCIPFHSGNDALLHQLANTLDDHKPDKGTHANAVGIELGGVSEILDKESLADETRAKAGQNQCNFVLVLINPDIKASLSYQPNVWYPEQQETTSTRDPYLRRQDRQYYVVVKYRLFRLDSTTAAIQGFITTHEAAPERTVVSNALAMLANQVFTRVTK